MDFTLYRLFYVVFCIDFEFLYRIRHNVSGDRADVWLKMQAAYDAWHAEREVDTSDIPTIRAV